MKDAAATSATPPVLPAGLPGPVFLLRAAWARLLERWKTLVLLTVVYWVVALVEGVLVLFWLLAMATSGLDPAINVSVLVGVFVLWAVLLVGSAALITTAGADQAVRFGPALRWGVRRLGPLLGAVLLLLLVALPFILALIVGALGSVAGAAFFASRGSGPLAFLPGAGASLIIALVLFLAFLYVGIRLSFALMLVALGEARVFAAFRESWRLTAGRFWAIVRRLIALSLVLGVATIPVSLLQSAIKFSVSETGDNLLAMVGIIIYLVANAAVTLFSFVYGVVLLRWVQHVAGPKPV